MGCAASSRASVAAADDATAPQSTTPGADATTTTPSSSNIVACVGCGRREHRLTCGSCGAHVCRRCRVLPPKITTPAGVAGNSATHLCPRCYVRRQGWFGCRGWCRARQRFLLGSGVAGPISAPPVPGSRCKVAHTVLHPPLICQTRGARSARCLHPGSVLNFIPRALGLQHLRGRRSRPPPRLLPI